MTRIPPTAAARGSHRHRPLRALSAALAGSLAGAAVLVAGAEGAWRWRRGRGAAMAAFTGLLPYALVPGWLAVLAGLLTRRRWVVAAGLPAAGAQVAATRRRRCPTPADAPTEGTRFRVVTANLLVRNARAQETWAIIEAEAPDLVLLQEVSPRSAGDWLPPAGWHAAVFADSASAFGTAVLSRHPLVASEQIVVGGLRQLRTTAVIDGSPVTVYSVHPAAPTSSTMARVWSAQLAELGERLAAEHGPVVMGGDFNATPDHHGFRDLLLAGRMRDAVVGRSLPTWPSRWYADPWCPPRVMALDHVLVRGLAVLAVRRLAAGQSDHHPLLADLLLPAAVTAVIS